MTAIGQKNWRSNLQQRKQIHNPVFDTTSAFKISQLASSRSNMDEQWNKLASSVIPEGEEVYSIKMVDENTIWMVSCTSLFAQPSGNAPNIFKSIDGGVSWEQFQIADTEGFYSVDISPIDAMTAYVVLWGPDFNDLSQDAIYKTIDGGTTWNKVDSYSFSPTYVHFFNEMEGWVFGGDNREEDGNFLFMSTTSDGGLTWEHAGGNDWIIPEGKVFPTQDTTEFLGTFLYSPSSNYDVAGSTIIVGGTNYWISQDKGLNWDRLQSPLDTVAGLVHGVVALKDSITYMFGSNTTVDFFFDLATTYATTDGGVTWTQSNPPINPSALEYLPGTQNDFIITGIDQGFDPSFGFGITGTARTSDLENWEIIQDVGLQSTDFIGENQGVGAFANYPGFVDGTVYSWGEKVILPYDALISRNNNYLYTIVTLNHLEEEVFFDYQIQNVGANDLDATKANVIVLRDGEIVYVDSTEISIQPDQMDSFLFSYLPEQVGVYEFQISVTHPELGDNFFSDSRFIEISETTLAKDNGIASLAFATDPERDDFPSGFFGSEFELLIEDRLVAISTVLDLFLSDSSATFNFLIKSIDEEGNVSEEDIYKSAPISVVEAFTEDFSHVTFPLPAPIVLPAGRYIFAVGQDEPQGIAAFNLTDQPNLGSWLFSEKGFDGEFLPWTNFPNDPTIMIRPMFEAAMSTSIEEESFLVSTPITVFPVPFQEELNILLEDFEDSSIQLQIFDMSGKLWTNTIANHPQLINQNVSNLPKGAYLLRLTSGKYQRSIKVLKQ